MKYWTRWCTIVYRSKLKCGYIYLSLREKLNPICFLEACLTIRIAHQNRRRHKKRMWKRQTLQQIQHESATIHVLHVMVNFYLIKFWFEAIHVCSICSPCHSTNEFACLVCFKSTLLLARVNPKKKRKINAMKSKMGSNIKYSKWFECRMFWSIYLLDWL